MKKLAAIVLTLMLAISFAGIASAHVTVQPKEAPANSYQVFTVRVPTEKEAATTQVKVVIPQGVSVSRFEPKFDWSYEVEKGADGAIVSVTWKATGAGLSGTEFGDFRMSGKVAEDAKELVWKAYQTYADGEVVEWTGAPDADKPASVTTVTAAAGDAHGAAAADDESNEGRDPLTFSLAVAAMGLSVVAFAMSLRKRRS
mgnify:CR=1 FL=1